MSLAQLAAQQIAQRGQQPTLLEQMQQRRMQEEEARVNNQLRQEQINSSQTNQQYQQVQMQKMQHDMQATQQEAQRRQKMMELMNTYTSPEGTPDFRKASRVAFGMGDVEMAKEILGLAETSQQMDKRGLEIEQMGQPAPYKPASPAGKLEEDVRQGVVPPEVAAASRQEDAAKASAATTTARVKAEDSAVFDLATIFDFDQAEPPENMIPVRERYIELVNSVGAARAQEQIKQEYQTKGFFGKGRFERVPEPPKRINSKEEYEALPPGKFYWGDENTTRTKK